jgi:hypothetical protein
VVEATVVATVEVVADMAEADIKAEAAVTAEATEL